MKRIEPDLRSEERKALDEKIAAEPELLPPELTPGERPRPLEEIPRERKKPDGPERY